MTRDGRNPYGSRGGYVRDSRGYDYNYDGRMMDRRGADYYPFELRGRVGGRYPEDYEYDMMYGRDMMDRRYDYYPRDGHSMMSEEELKHWGKRLLDEVNDKDRQYLKMENVIKKAEQLGIRFDEFTPYEYYITVLMMFTDHYKTLGTANYDIYMKLAKDWLCDEDAAVQYGKKLTAYYENIVNDRF